MAVHVFGCVQDWFHQHKPSVAPHFRPYVPDALPTEWYRQFEQSGTQDSMWEMWFIRYMHEQQVRKFIDGQLTIHVKLN